jgi:hypothetical protein
MDAAAVRSERRIDSAPVRVRCRWRDGCDLLVCNAGEGIEEVDCIATLYSVR